MSKPVEKEFLTLREAATMLGVHYETLRRWWLKKGLKGYKHGRTLRFKKDDLLEFMSQH
ncbi:MAG: helix-turn-helix domain-containing protein [bacterium]|nr:helix-turn-helix domain-containing protein [bacterium]